MITLFIELNCEVPFKMDFSQDRNKDLRIVIPNSDWES